MTRIKIFHQHLKVTEPTGQVPMAVVGEGKKRSSVTGTTARIDRPVLRYLGGKWRIAKWILQYFAAHHIYVEPYAGGASLLFRKASAPVEVLNDLDGEVINFFHILRTRTKELIQLIERTPYARAEVLNSWEPAVGEPLEQARRFYVRCWQAFGPPTAQARTTGWRFQRNSRRSPVKSWNDTDRLWAVAGRLKQVHIECSDALGVIRRFDSPETLFYVDPPYVASTRTASTRFRGYRHEMTDEQHVQLADLLKNVQGMVMLSGYTSPLYEMLYSGWTCVQAGTNV
jgi:DNA adenine methylase